MVITNVIENNQKNTQNAMQKVNPYHTAVLQWQAWWVRRKLRARTRSLPRLETSSFDLQTSWWSSRWTCCCRSWPLATTCSSCCHASRRRSRESENLRRALERSTTASRSPRCTQRPSALAARTADLARRKKQKCQNNSTIKYVWSV